MLIPNRIRYWRDQAGLTQEQLADAIGATRQTVHHLEQGKGGISPDKLRGLSRALKVEPWQLLDGSEIADAAVRREAPTLDEVYTAALAVEKWVRQGGFALSPEDKASLVRTVCRHIAKLRGQPAEHVAEIVAAFLAAGTGK
ncbi:helix-turn-helix transcriptional regulator [Tistrella bauzanensis]|nr:helix-turn-helix transcriptional regulator [Tistrella bauzanensis]